ncbi:MAG TPA: acyltransferase [Paludibacteraceae bacterium]|nr:acyltransferase [Paludibacteraceae bacterium]
MSIINKLIQKVKKEIAFRTSEGAINYWRSLGIEIGEGSEAPHPKTVQMDVTRTCLIKIGKNVRLNRDLTIMNHDYAGVVFLRKNNEFINSSGRITIGDNVYFGRHCTVLKGVTIGDNCIIGYGSVVMRDIPANSVAAGTPAKVVCTLDEYYEKRKKRAMGEAFEYARTIQERLHRRPVPADFYEEFHYFVDGSNADQYPEIPLRKQLRESYDEWMKEHKRTFDTFDDFLKAAGIE